MLDDSLLCFVYHDPSIYRSNIYKYTYFLALFHVKKSVYRLTLRTNPKTSGFFQAQRAQKRNFQYLELDKTFDYVGVFKLKNDTICIELEKFKPTKVLNK